MINGGKEYFGQIILFGDDMDTNIIDWWNSY